VPITAISPIDAIKIYREREARSAAVAAASWMIFCSHCMTLLCAAVNGSLKVPIWRRPPSLFIDTLSRPSSKISEALASVVVMRPGHLNFLLM